MCLQVIFEDIIKLLSVLLSWPAVFLIIILIFRRQIGGIIPGLANRVRSFSHGDTKVEFIEQMKENVKEAIESNPGRFSDADKSKSNALIRLLETGNADDKAYAFEALKDIGVSLPGSKQEINRHGEQEINQISLSNYLRRTFPDRIHAEQKHVSEIVNELLRENLKYIKDIEALIQKYPVELYISPLDEEIGVKSADVGVIRSLLVAKKIDEIKSVIESWRPLPSEPSNLIDREPFVNLGSGLVDYLMKSGDNIKIHTTNVGDLEITFDELGNRIGTGLPYLRRLMKRLDPFHTYFLSKDYARGQRGKI